jgi:hypothetical protein
VAAQDLAFGGELVGVAAKVCVSAVLRADAQGDLLSASGDPQRDALFLYGPWPNDGAVEATLAR